MQSLRSAITWRCSACERSRFISVEAVDRTLPPWPGLQIAGRPVPLAPSRRPTVGDNPLRGDVSGRALLSAALQKISPRRIITSLPQIRRPARGRLLTR